MPESEEIIDFLKKSQLENPEKFQKDLDYYKTNYPDFYKDKIAPVFEKEAQVIKEEDDLTQPNQSLEEQTQTETSPSTSIDEAVEAKSGPVKKSNTKLLIILNWASVVLFLFFVPLILFFTTKDERVKKHARIGSIVVLVLLILTILQFIVFNFILTRT